MGKSLKEVDELSEREFQEWCSFYALYPFDDYHRLHRPASAIGAASGGKLDEILKFLSPQPDHIEMSDADRDIARALGFST